MKRSHLGLVFTIFLIISAISQAWAQVPNKSVLNIQDFMAQNYVGEAPRIAQWSQDSKQLFFYWKEAHAKSDSAFQISIKDLSPVRIDPEVILKDRPERGNFNTNKSLKILSDNQGLSLVDVKKKDTIPFFFTNYPVSGVSFSHDESKVVFNIDQDLFYWDIQTGTFRQLTNFQAEREKREAIPKTTRNEQDEWLFQDQKILFPKVRSRGNRSGGNFTGFGNSTRGRGASAGPSPIFLDGYSVMRTALSPDNRFVTYSLYKRAESSKGTEMPDYVTASGYTEIKNTRSKVGNLPSEMKLGIYNVEKDSAYYLDISSLPGVFDAPDYFVDYPDRPMKYEQPKSVNLSGPNWSPNGQYGIVTAQSADNKDRWICLIDLEAGTLKNLDHDHDPAWIGGPGIGYGSVSFMPDNKSIYYQSEETGFSHLYLLNLETGKKTALTSGNFEVYQPYLSKDKKYWYFHSNEVHPGEKHFYRMPLLGGERVQITTMIGSNTASMSPDEKHLAITYSFANRPPEIYYQANKAGAVAVQITDSRSTAYRAYDWRIPEFTTFKAEDGAQVHARLYRPSESNNNKAAVIFVHGAGYLQNAHKWWSTYYHEYMFHNLLVDNGYTVLDIDYRGSAGYGRDWRTGIYRWMGGKDLSDQVDGAKYLVNACGVDADKIGIYGGSYGGFITLMALFNAPDVFAAGAALRSVTDWAHYNHGYTANILNTPVLDSLAYAKSSPIYFAEGLKGDLLMCHGMLDSNVHFQDIVRLSQRLIDLGKDNWELAVYPLQAHSFTDPDAWTDEYKRIFKLFQNTIGK